MATAARILARTLAPKHPPPLPPQVVAAYPPPPPPPLLLLPHLPPVSPSPPLYRCVRA